MSEKKTQDKNYLVTLIGWSIMTICIVAVSVLFTMNQSVVISQAAEELRVEENAEMQVQKATFVESGDDRIHVVLEGNPKAKDIVLENRYSTGELWIHIRGNGTCKDQIAVPGRLFLEAQIERGETETLLKIKADKLMEYKSTLDGNELKIACGTAHELFRMFAMVYADESDPLMAGVTTLLKEKSVGLEEKGIRLYFASGSDAQAIVTDLKPDFYLWLTTAQDTDTTRYGIDTYYQKTFYSENLPVTALADSFARCTAVEAVNRANGLFADPEGEIDSIPVPSIKLSLGYRTNPDEEALLMQDAYRAKLADGIYNAILEVYTGYYEN